MIKSEQHQVDGILSERQKKLFSFTLHI